MTPAIFVFCLSSLFVEIIAQTNELRSVRQQSGFISAYVGDEVTLQCFYKDDATMLYWSKQTPGQKPRLISTLYKYDIRGIFHNEFKNKTRFTLDTEMGKNHLKISDLRVSDSATYYCASIHTFIFEFAEGTTVSVKGSGLTVPASVYQSASETMQAGGSVTLNCTVHTGTCDGEHSVYWFKNSEESHPGLIYTHGGGNDQCESKPDTKTHTCVYNLRLKSLNPSHAGTYYCAVSSCGHILFGNGTKLDIEDVESLVLVYFWNQAFAFTSILSVFLALLVCMMNKRKSCLYTESQPRLSDSSKTNIKGYQNGDRFHSVALTEMKINSSRKQRDDTWSECVYFSVKQ